MHGLLAAAALAWTFLGCGQVSASAASLQVAQQLGSTSLPGPPANCSEATRRSVRWGVATAAYQVEGAANVDGRSPSIWDTYAHTPGVIKNNDTGDVACDMYHKYPEDFELMSSLGIKHYRFSISWSRVLPQGVAGSPVNAKGVAFYNSMINEMLKHGITPHATLFHWDLPQVLQDRYRGFLGDQFGDDFEFYARTVFESFGDRVASWMTFNEPVVICEISYGKGTFPPGPFGREGQYRCGHNLLLAHARVYRLYESRFRAQQRGRIGIALSVHWGEPLTASAADAAASVFYIDQHLGWFLAPLTFGDYPPQLRRCVAMLPPFSAQQAASLKGSLDFVGINFYTARYIRGSTADSCVVEQLTKDAQGRQIGPRAESDWLYVAPWAFYKLLKFVHERYGGPIVYITENGVSVPGEDGKPLAQALADTFRLEYFRDHLDSLCRAVADGVRVKHYFAWSILDNFEWREGFSTRFGLVNVDFKSPARTRTVKNSGKWLAAHFFRLNGGSGGAAEAAHRKKGT